MSPDDPKAKGEKKPRQRRAAASPAPAPQRIASSTVDEARVPRSVPPSAAPSSPTGRPRILSTLLISVGILLFVSFVLLNARSGSTQTAVSGIPGAGNPSSYGEPPPSSTPSVTTPPPHPLPAGVIWRHTISTDINSSFNIDHYPISDEPTGFEVTDIGAPRESLETVGGTKEVEWTAARQPYLRDCRASLAATTGAEHIQLVHSGQWICVETSAHNIGRLRFLGAHGNTYSFDTTVYRP